MESDFERSPSGIADLFKKTKIRKNISKKINKEISNKHYQKFDKHKIYFNFEKIKQRLERNHYVEKNIKISYLYFYLNYIFGKIHPLTKNPFRILKFKKELRPATGYEYIYWIARATLKTFILKILYYLFSTNKLPKKYILFAMSYQPEATSYPDAGIFHNQIEIITKISTIIDKNTNIIVKEHPMQLNLLGPFNYKNSQIRDLNVYNKLLKLKNVKLLSQNFNMDEATKKADYTLTINGSVALQSVKNGTPVLTFGHAWYVGCSSVYKLKSILEIKYFLNSKKFKIVDKSKIIHFMDCLDKMSIRLWYKKFQKFIYSFSKLTKKKNRENIKKIIRRDLKHFYKIYV